VEASCALDGRVVRGGVCQRTFADHVVRDDHAAHAREFQGPLEVIGNARFVGIDEHEVERPATFRLEFGQRVERAAGSHLNDVRETGPGNIGAGGLGVFEVASSVINRPPAGRRGRARWCCNAERADFEDRARALNFRQQMQQLSLRRRHVDRRQTSIRARLERASSAGSGGMSRSVM